MIRYGSSLVCVLTLAAALPGVGAEQTVLDLDPVLIGASRLADPVFGGPPPQTLDKWEFNLINPRSVWEALEELPGLYIEQPGAMGGNASLYLRGGDPNFTKVLIDGIEVNDPNSTRGGTYNFSAIAPRSVQALHLLPGAQSAIHGADALSGVILLETINAGNLSDLPQQEFSIEAGQGGFYSIDGRMTGALDDLYVQGGFNYAEEDGAVEGSTFDALRGNAGAVWSFAEGRSLTFSAFGAEIDSTRYPDDGGGPRYSSSTPMERHSTEEWGSSLRLDAPISDGLRLNGKAAYYSLRSDLWSPGVAAGLRDPMGIPPNSMDGRLDRWVIGLSLSQTLTDSLLLAYGTELAYEKGRSDSVVTIPLGFLTGSYDRNVRTGSVFGELGWEFAHGHRIYGALRYDDVEDLDSVVTGRSAYSIDLPTIRSQLQLAYAEGFKKPSFFALGNPMVGNPDLEPEESELYEASLVTYFRDGAIKVINTVYRQEFANLIDLTEDGLPRMINLAEVVSEGATTEIDWRINDRFSIGGSASWLDLEVVDSDELLRNRPKWRLRSRLTYRPLEQLSLSVVGAYVTERADSSIPTGNVIIDKSLVWDAALAWTINPRLRLTLSVDDVLDERVEEAVGFFTYGRRFRLSATAAW